jgi:two-component system, chemotaxis family, chemotaxis protein CheY
MKILVVDDEVVSRKKMEMILKSFGSVECVTRGKVALETFRKACEDRKPFGLVSLDISMPDMDGSEVLKQIRAVEEEIGVGPEGQARVMMVTSKADRNTVIMCTQNGCDDYVVKPFTRETVTAKLYAMGLPVVVKSQTENR